MIWLVGYVCLAVLLAQPAHRVIYPLIGYGHPLTGLRLWLVRAFAPLLLLGIGLWRAPIFALVLLREEDRRR